MLTRWVVFLTCCGGAFLSLRRGASLAVPAYLIVGAVFNPFYIVAHGGFGLGETVHSNAGHGYGGEEWSITLRGGFAGEITFAVEGAAALSPRLPWQRPRDAPAGESNMQRVANFPPGAGWGRT